MDVLASVVLAFACFSAIPMPYVEWSERNKRYLMAAFPLVGVVVGIVQLGWWHLCVALELGSMLRGVGLAITPVLVTGGIHLDGLADVIDALSSHASAERKRVILKDPHLGAFAVIGICCYLLAYAGLAAEVGPVQVLPMAVIPVASRCLSGWATISWRRSSEQGMLASEAAPAAKTPVRVILALLLGVVALLMLACNIVVGGCMLVGAAVVMLVVHYMAQTEFGGMSGDVAGYLLEVCELVMLACLVIAGRLV